MNTYDRIESIPGILHRLLSGEKLYFSELKPSTISDKIAGIYAIFNKETGETLYVGRTKNLRQRLYNNHLLGPLSNARLKKYLLEDPTEFPGISTIGQAKQFIKDKCYFQFIPENDMLTRGQIEGLLSYLLNVKYMHEEH